MSESIIEPELPIIDPHHHLWDLRARLPMFPQPHHDFIASIAGAAHYTFDQLLADVQTGHNIIATVYMECGSFYNSAYPPEKKPVGEVEYVNGVAAQSASGLYGNFRACSAIVGHADLTLGSAVAPVLEALSAAGSAAGNGRFRGIRHQGAWDANPDVLGPPFHAPQGLYSSDGFRAGFAELGKQGMTFDAWVLEPQLEDVIELAKAFPDQPIMLDHCGTPLNIANYRGTLPENFARWCSAIERLGELPNVWVKLGGLAMANCGMPEEGPAKGFGSETLAPMWKPYIEKCIEAFGTKRAMFESNYPVDRWGATYPVLWNSFKRITADYSDAEKADLYAGNAARFYRIG